MTGALDNDVIHKAAWYGLLDDISAFVDPEPAQVAILGAARFVIKGLITRAPPSSETPRVLAAIEQFARVHPALEPTTEEQELAASIELIAQRRAVPLDTGESQLCAIAIARGLSRILTGDKRAIEAMEQLLSVEQRLLQLTGCIHCLEQAVHALLLLLGGDALRERICAAPQVDTALSMCFSCPSAPRPDAAYIEGLQSYIRAARAAAPTMLAS